MVWGRGLTSFFECGYAIFSSTICWKTILSSLKCLRTCYFFMAWRKQQWEAKEVAEEFLDASGQWWFIVALLCLPVTSSIPFNPHKTLWSKLWLFPLYRWRSQGLEKLRSLPSRSLLISSGAGLWIQAHLTPALPWRINYWVVPEITMAANYVSATILSMLLIHFIPTVTIRGVYIIFIPTYGWINGGIESLNK